MRPVTTISHSQYFSGVLYVSSSSSTGARTNDGLAAPEAERPLVDGKK